VRSELIWVRGYVVFEASASSCSFAPQPPLGIPAIASGKAAPTVKVTIDSSEPLENAVRVLGAMYDVTLVLSPTGSGKAQESRSKADRAASAKPPRRAMTSRTTPKRKPSTRQKSRSDQGSAAVVSNAEVRSWAREHGYMVAERGRLPAEVVQAYRAARTG
jgi:hypothetical protein